MRPSKELNIDMAEIRSSWIFGIHADKTNGVSVFESGRSSTQMPSA
jgi:hypothetical protein